MIDLSRPDAGNSAVATGAARTRHRRDDPAVRAGHGLGGDQAQAVASAPRGVSGGGDQPAILTVLRQTAEPLTTQDLTLRVMAERSLTVADRKLVHTVQKWVGASLRNMRARGSVASENGRRDGLRWGLREAAADS